MMFPNFTFYYTSLMAIENMWLLFLWLFPFITLVSMFYSYPTASSPSTLLRVGMLFKHQNVKL